MSGRKKRTENEVCQDHFDHSSLKLHYDSKYSEAFKIGTTILHNNLNDRKKQGKRGFGSRAIANELNKSMLGSPNDRKLTHHALARAVTSRGEFGISPPKLGAPRKVPLELTKALATHATMMQVSGEGEASAIKMIALIEALKSGSKWEAKLSTGYLWRLTRKEHPAIMNPVSAKNHEDRQVDWLSYKNITEWNSRAKKFLCDIGMAKNEPGIIRKFRCSVFLFLSYLLTLLFYYF